MRHAARIAATARLAGLLACALAGCQPAAPPPAADQAAVGPPPGPPAEAAEKMLSEKELSPALWNLPFDKEKYTAVMFDVAELKKQNVPTHLHVTNIVRNAAAETLINEQDKYSGQGLGHRTLLDASALVRVLIRFEFMSSAYRQVNVEYADPVDVAAFAAHYQFKRTEQNGVPVYAKGGCQMIQAAPKVVIYCVASLNFEEKEAAPRELDQITRQVAKPVPVPGMPGRMLKLASGYPKLTLMKMRPNPNDTYAKEVIVIGESGREHYQIDAPADPSLLPEMYDLFPKRKDLDGVQNHRWIDDRLYHTLKVYSGTRQI